MQWLGTMIVALALMIFLGVSLSNAESFTSPSADQAAQPATAVLHSAADKSGATAPQIELKNLSGCTAPGVVGAVESGTPVRALEVRRECDPVMWRVEVQSHNAGQRGGVPQEFIQHAGGVTQSLFVLSATRCLASLV